MAPKKLGLKVPNDVDYDKILNKTSGVYTVPKMIARFEILLEGLSYIRSIIMKNDGSYFIRILATDDINADTPVDDYNELDLRQSAYKVLLKRTQILGVHSKAKLRNRIICFPKPKFTPSLADKAYSKVLIELETFVDRPQPIGIDWIEMFGEVITE